MINYQPSTQMDFKLANQSKPVYFEADKFYYFKQIIYPTWNAIGRGYVGYKKVGSTGDFQTVPSSWLRYKQITNEYKFKHQYVPNFERIYLMDEQNQLIKNDQSKWNVYNVPWGQIISDSHVGQGQGGQGLTATQSLTDSDDTTDYTAIVRIDGIIVGLIHDSFDVQGDKKRLTKASRSHLSLLFYYQKLDPSIEHNLTIKVVEGQITLAGLLIKWWSNI